MVIGWMETFIIIFETHLLHFVLKTQLYSVCIHFGFQIIFQKNFSYFNVFFLSIS